MANNSFMANKLNNQYSYMLTCAPQIYKITGKRNIQSHESSIIKLSVEVYKSVMSLAGLLLIPIEVLYCSQSSFSNLISSQT